MTTATPRCTVALVDLGGAVVAQRSYDDEKNHAERVFESLDDLFEDASCERHQVTSVACDVGPGSFTGVRVGLSSAKGIALGLGVPLVGVGSLEAMCAAALHHAPREAALACALLDAKRGETFVAAYDREGCAYLEPMHTAVGRAGDQVRERLGPAIETAVFCGRAAPREGVEPIVRHIDCELPDASWIARVAARMGCVDGLNDLEPIYVRGPDAKPMAECAR